MAGGVWFVVCIPTRFYECAERGLPTNYEDNDKHLSDDAEIDSYLENNDLRNSCEIKTSYGSGYMQTAKRSVPNGIADSQPLLPPRNSSPVPPTVPRRFQSSGCLTTEYDTNLSVNPRLYDSAGNLRSNQKLSESQESLETVQFRQKEGRRLPKPSIPKTNSQISLTENTCLVQVIIRNTRNG